MKDQELIDAIVARLAAIEGVQAVLQETENLADIPSPGIFLDVERIGPGDNSGTGQFCGQMEFAAFAIVRRCDPHADRQARQLALKIMTVVNRARNFGVADVKTGVISGADRDPFDFVGRSDDNQYAATWVARWSHKFLTGDNVWHSDEIVPVSLTINEHVGGA